MKRLAVLLALAAPALAAAEVGTWSIDPNHTNSTFAVRHLVISTVRGEFGKTSGTVSIDDKDVTKSSVEATIDTATVNTRVEDRDKDLKSPNFFDVEKFPTITFKSTKVQRAGEGQLKVTGDLTIKGVTKPVVLEVAGPTKPIKDPWGNERRGFSAITKINRQDFGLTYSKVIEAGPVVGDKVTIQIDGELTRPAAEPKQAASK
jgi:polyisoprenoid-binding protein YceI